MERGRERKKDRETERDLYFLRRETEYLLRYMEMRQQKKEFVGAEEREGN